MGKGLAKKSVRFIPLAPVNKNKNILECYIVYGNIKNNRECGADLSFILLFIVVLK